MKGGSEMDAESRKRLEGIKYNHRQTHMWPMASPYDDCPECWTISQVESAQATIAEQDEDAEKQTALLAIAGDTINNQAAQLAEKDRELGKMQAFGIEKYQHLSKAKDELDSQLCAAKEALEPFANETAFAILTSSSCSVDGKVLDHARKVFTHTVPCKHEAEVERLKPCHQFALTLPIGRSFVEFGGNISGRLYTLKREHEEKEALFIGAKEELDCVHGELDAEKAANESLRTELDKCRRLNQDEVEKWRNLASLNANSIIEARKTNESLCTALGEIREVYAGMEGFTPETCPEGYQQQIIKQMYTVAVDAIANLREKEGG